MTFMDFIKLAVSLSSLMFIMLAALGWYAMGLVKTMDLAHVELD